MFDWSLTATQIYFLFLMLAALALNDVWSLRISLLSALFGAVAVVIFFLFSLRLGDDPSRASIVVTAYAVLAAFLIYHERKHTQQREK